MSSNLGKWNKDIGRSGVVGTHAALLHTGQILFYSRPESPSHKYNTLDNGFPEDSKLPTCIVGEGDKCTPDLTLSSIINLSEPDAFKPLVVQVEHNPFCSGLTFLQDGSLFVAGGDKKHYPSYNGVPENTKFDGRRSLRTFTPGTAHTEDHGLWKEIGEMSSSRWYPTCALLSDGRVLIISGYLDDMEAYNQQNPTCEIYPPIPNGLQYMPALVDAWPYDSYPFVFVLPYGSVFLFVKDMAYDLRLEIDKFGRERWAVKAGAKLPFTEDGKEEPAKQYPNSATAVLLPLLPANAYSAEVLIMGGGGVNVHTHWGEVHGTGQMTYDQDASSSCFRMQVDPPANLQWERDKMNYKRVMADAVLLPDGTVLVVNGTSKGFAGGNAATGPMRPDNAVKSADLYDPFKKVWRPLAEANFIRLYHSTALLLPDATIMVAGSDHQKHDSEKGESESDVYRALTYEYEIEIFEPPYLFNGEERAERPVIKAAPESIFYREQFKIEIEGQFDNKHEDLRIAILRPGSVTHGNNMSQRYIGLNIVDLSPTNLLLEAPPNGKIAPPGYYMLFLLQKGVPSIAKFIHLLLNPSIESNDSLPPSTGMALWLRADEGVKTEDSSGKVLSWLDSSGQGNDLYLKKNADVPPRPSPKWIHNEMNGHPIVRFGVMISNKLTSGACLESLNKEFLPGSSPYSVFLVTNPWPPCNLIPLSEREVGWSDLIGWGDYTQPNSNAFVGLRLGPFRPLHYQIELPPEEWSALPKDSSKASILNYWNIDWQYGHQGYQEKGSKFDPEKDPLIPLSAVLLEMFYDGHDTGMRLNGYEIKRDTAPFGGRNTGKGPLTIGLNGGLSIGENDIRGAFFRGDIAEIIIYERNIEGSERYEIQEYLRNKYALW